MSTIYLTAVSGKLHKKDQTLRLVLDDDTTRTIFPFKTDQLVIIGNIDISTPALKFLMHHQIDTVFINKNGRYNGRLDFRKDKNVFLRQRQFKLVEDEAFKLRFARALVLGKLHNQLNFMQRINRKEKQKGDFKEQLRQVKTAIRNSQEADNVESLRGYEGTAARAFFRVYREAILQDWAVFNGRSMNPPRDNVNAVLSFLYTLLLNRVDAALEAEGLDPYVGYFHRIDYGKRSLSFDLMEEYRTPLADTLTAALFNLGILQEDDFRSEIFSDKSDDYPLAAEEGHEAFEECKGVLLNRQGLKKVIVQWEKKLENELYYAYADKRMSYKNIIVQQVKHFRRVIMGEEQDYKPLTLK